MKSAIKNLMFEVSNNTLLTQQTMNTVFEKFNATEQREFLEWLKIVRSERHRDISDAKRQARWKI